LYVLKNLHATPITLPTQFYSQIYQNYSLSAKIRDTLVIRALDIFHKINLFCGEDHPIIQKKSARFSSVVGDHIGFLKHAFFQPS
jgi:hypothetical protein